MMKVKRAILFCLFLLILSAGGRAYAWQIEEFKSVISVEADSTVLVTEEITANFSDQAKHGIIRKIPLAYRDEKGNSIDVRFGIEGIEDENGRAWKYEEYPSAGYKVLKIGSAYTAYNGLKKFIIRYKVRGAILFLEGHDELYWNATGNEWDAPISKASVFVHLAEPAEKDSIRATAFTGRYGSRENTANVEIVDGQNVNFSAGALSPYEGLTIVVGWPKGLVEAPLMSAAADTGYPHQNAVKGYLFFVGAMFSLLILPLAVFLVMYYQWKKYGKDPQLHKAIMVEYKAPEGLTPAEVGTLLDDKVDVRDISSTIIDLAVKGYLKIVDEGKVIFRRSFSFVKIKDHARDDALTPFEKIILDGIFEDAAIGGSASMDSLENKFYTKIKLINEAVIVRLMDKGFYARDPHKAVSFYRKIAVAVLFFALFAFVFFPLAISLFLSAAVIFNFAKYMPAKSRKGMDAYGKILGFEEFLERVEKDKIKFEERRQVFEKMLPYAMCLGIVNQWTKAFADIYNQPPSWFSGDFRDGFTMAVFLDSLNNSVSRMNNTFTSAPRSVSSGGGFGGGGSSGGGFGGGGGSSW